MTRLELHSLIENRLKQISQMSAKDRLKVADFIKEIIDEFLNINPLEFEYEELIKIFEMTKNSAVLSATHDYNDLISGRQTTRTDNGYLQVHFSLMTIKSYLRIDTKS